MPYIEYNKNNTLPEQVEENRINIKNAVETSDIALAIAEEVKKQINSLLLRLKEDKQFKKEFTSYLFDEPIPKVAPLPEKLLDFVVNFEYYSMN